MRGIRLQNALAQRTEKLKNYLTEELQEINKDTTRKDIPVSSKVNAVQICSIAQDGSGRFDVTYSVGQEITESGNARTVQSSFETTVYVDAAGNMVLIKNPTLASTSGKSDYEPAKMENDGSVDSTAADEITDFLNTFFKIYPSATEKELAYYVTDGVLPPIGKAYTFAELADPVYVQDGDHVKANFFVKYLDPETDVTQISQYSLLLTKIEGNWKIIGQ